MKKSVIDREDTINDLETIATSQPGKNAQPAAKKISEKYKKIREAKRRKNIYRLLGKIFQVETVDIPQGNVEVLIPIPKSNISARFKALKLATLRGNQQIVDKTENKPKSTKSAQTAAKKITEK